MANNKDLKGPYYSFLLALYIFTTTQLLHTCKRYIVSWLFLSLIGPITESVMCKPF